MTQLHDERDRVEITHHQAQTIRTLAEIIPSLDQSQFDKIIKAVTSNDLTLLIPNTETENQPA